MNNRQKFKWTEHQVDKSNALPEIQKGGIPIYDTDEIDCMLNAQDNNERQKLHSFKKTFGAKIRKQVIHR